MHKTKTKNQPHISSPHLDYLVIGHLTQDLTETGERLGGTVTFSGLTAAALSMNTGIFTSFGPNIDPAPLRKLWIHNQPCGQTTTFKNISDGKQRTQYLYDVAKPISVSGMKTFQPSPAIVHLGPMANEVDPNLLREFPNSLRCLTPQGWFRRRGKDDKVIFQPWDSYTQFLPMAHIAVTSLEDLNGDERLIEEMAGLIPVLVITENEKGARVYWHNEAKFITAPEVKYEEDTGAGDIFAAAFFYRFFHTKDPWEAGRFAVLLASWSVTRSYFDSIPKPEEIEKAKVELIGNQGIHNGLG